MVRARDDGAGSLPAARARTAEDLEVPRPLRPAAHSGLEPDQVRGAARGRLRCRRLARWPRRGPSRGARGHLAHRGCRKVATGSVPSLLTMSAVVLTAQAAVVLATGELWLFLLQFPLANIGLTVAFARTARGQNPVVADPRGCPRPPATAIGPGPAEARPPAPLGQPHRPRQTAPGRDQEGRSRRRRGDPGARRIRQPECGRTPERRSLNPASPIRISDHLAALSRARCRLRLMSRARFRGQLVTG